MTYYVQHSFQAGSPTVTSHGDSSPAAVSLHESWPKDGTPGWSVEFHVEHLTRLRDLVAAVAALPEAESAMSAGERVADPDRWQGASVQELRAALLEIAGWMAGEWSADTLDQIAEQLHALGLSTERRSGEVL